MVGAVSRGGGPSSSSVVPSCLSCIIFVWSGDRARTRAPPGVAAAIRGLREAGAGHGDARGATASGVAVWARMAAGPVRTSLISSDCLVVSVLRKICFS